MKLQIAFLLFCFTVFSRLNGQDIHFSQFQTANTLFNPASNGFFNGDYRAMIIHRSQWKSVTVPFVTTGITLDGKLLKMNEKKNSLNAGLNLYQDKAGDGALQTIFLQFAPSYLLSVGGDSSTFVSIGAGIGYLSKQVNFSKLTFDNQFDGELFDASFANGEPIGNDKASAIDISAGINVLKRLKENFNIGFGIGAMHINQPLLSFVKVGSVKYGQLLSAFLIADYGLSKQLSIQPSITYAKQKSLTEIGAGSMLAYSLKYNKSGVQNLKCGVFYRIDDAIIIQAGAGYRNLNIGLSYDINISEFERATNKRGATEISLSYIFSKVKKIKPSAPCLIF